MDNFDVLRLDGHTLRVFLTVVHTGSISKTADAFDLNQSTISHTIDKMRAAVGDPLFVKSGRGITPTEKCIALVPRVQEILASIEGLFEENTYDVANDSRPIVVGIPTPSLMPEMKLMQQELHRVAPKMVFQVSRIAPRERLAEMLELEEVDVAIAINTERFPATLNAIAYGEDELVVYYDPACRGPVTNVDEYVRATHAVAGFGGKGKSIVEKALEEIGLQRHIGFIAPTASSLGEFLIGTDMIATMPRGLAKAAYSELAFSAPPIDLPPLRLDLVWHKRFDHSGRNTWIRRALLEHRFERLLDPSSEELIPN